jgi:ribosome maturation factor RimP
MSLIIEKIQGFLSPILENTEIFLVEIAVRGERTGKVVEIYLDTDTGITLDECSSVSRQLAQQLDLSDIIPGRYRLDVSSPGLDKPLRIPRQFKKNIGRRCTVAYTKDGISISSTGILEDVHEDSLTLSEGKARITCLFSEIKEMYIIPQIK